MADLLEKYRWAIVVLLTLPLAAGIGFLLSQRLDEPDPLSLNSTPGRDLRVYITGAVHEPGVYTVAEGDRWVDAIDKAGGPLEDADVDAVDRARRVTDEETITVPYLGRVDVAAALQPPLIDLNTAGAAEIETLPGIGEVRAGDIVRSRESDGPFASIDELLTRDLIPESVYASIEDLVTVGGP